MFVILYSLKSIELVNIFFFPWRFRFDSSCFISVSLWDSYRFFYECFLFSEDVISQKYNNDGNISKRTTLILSFISNAIGYLISSIVVKLIHFSPALELYSKEQKRENEYI